MKYLTIFSLSLVIISCSKNDLPMPCDSESQSVNANFPMTAGSYWVYDLTRVSDLDTTFIRTDTLFVTGEEIIDNELYSVFSHLTPFPSYLRQSEDELYTPNNLWAKLDTGENTFLSSDTLFIGEQPFLTSYGYMSTEQINVEVPSGEFTCFHRLAEYTAIDPDYPHGVRTDNYFIADAIGVVKFNYFFYSSPDYFFYELVDYHIE